MSDSSGQYWCCDVILSAGTACLILGILRRLNNFDLLWDIVGISNGTNKPIAFGRTTNSI